MSWKIINYAVAQREHDHFYFVDEGTRRFAVADHSMRRAGDPSSTDDGLLLLDRSRRVEVSPNGMRVPVLVGGSEAWVQSCIENAIVVAPVLKSYGFSITATLGLHKLHALYEEITA